MIKVLNTHHQSQILGINARELGHCELNDLCVWGEWLKPVDDHTKPEPEPEPEEPKVEPKKRTRRTKAEMAEARANGEA